MFWIAIFAALSAAALIKLGALSVWVYVLSAALAGMTAVIVAAFTWSFIGRVPRM